MVKVKVKRLKRTRVPKIQLPKTYEELVDELTLYAIDVALRETLLGKAPEQAEEIIERCKCKPEFVKLWHKLGKTMEDLDTYKKGANNAVKPDAK